MDTALSPWLQTQHQHVASSYLPLLVYGGTGDPSPSPCQKPAGLCFPYSSTDTFLGSPGGLIYLAVIYEAAQVQSWCFVWTVPSNPPHQPPIFDTDFNRQLGSRFGTRFTSSISAWPGGCVWTPRNTVVVRRWPWSTEWIINHSRRGDEFPSIGPVVDGLLWQLNKTEPHCQGREGHHLKLPTCSTRLWWI